MEAQNVRHIELAIETLKLVAANDSGASVEIIARLAAAGFQPPASIASAAQSLRGITVGDCDPARGVYLGEWQAAPGHVVQAYADDDFLRDDTGEQLVLTFNEAVTELAKRNDGRAYGDGTERSLRQAIKSGVYRDGDRVLPPKELLHGRDARGNTVCPVQNVFELMKAGKLPKIAAAVETGRGDERWAVSGSEPSVYTSSVYHVSLTDGDYGWNTKGYLRSAVVPVRLYRNPASSAAPAPGG